MSPKPKPESPFLDLLDHMDQSNFTQLFDIAVKNVQYRDEIRKRFFMEKLHLHKKTFIVVAKDSMIPLILLNDKVVLSEDDVPTLIEVLGPIIKTMELYCIDFDPALLKNITSAMNMYSTKSLKVLTLNNCSEDTINQLKARFDKVDTVQFLGTNFQGNKACPNLNGVFPNALRVDVELSEGINAKCFEQRFSRLTHFEFHGSNAIGNAKEILKMNDHLESIAIWNKLDPDFLSFMNRSLPRLNDMRFHVVAPDFFTPNTYQPAHFKNLKIVRILTDFDYHSEPQQLPITFDELEVFSLIRTDISDRWIDFITQNKKLKSLAVPRGIINHKQWVKVGNELADLHEVTAIWSRANADEITRFMEKSKNLKKIFFLNIDLQNRRLARNAIDSKWNGEPLESDDSNGVVFLPKEDQK